MTFKVVEKEEDNRELLNLKESSLAKLVAKSQEIADKCEDFTVKRANNTTVRLNDLGGLTYVNTEDGLVHSSPLSSHALSQLSGKIGVPTKYIEKCIASGRIDLAQDNVNSWLSDFDKDLFIREHEGKVRGVLSTKYSVCDSHELLDIMNDTLDTDYYKVKGSLLTPERFHLRLVQKDRLPIDGEDLFGGFTIDSSDVGRSILKCSYFIYKQVCTNGLIVAKSSSQLFSQKHIGISAEEFAQGFKSTIELIPQLNDMVVKSIQLTQKDHSYSIENESEDFIESLVEVIKANAKLPEESARKVVSIMQSGKYPKGKWGYINSLTEVAQDFTLEKRLEIEQYAGSLLLVA